MCGLVYAKSTKPGHSVNKAVISAFNHQRSRGTEGFGLYDGQYKHIIKSTTEKNIKKFLLRKPSTEILFHHRNPTSTPNVKNAAHPFSTKKMFGKTEYILIHNGIIYNADALAEKHAEFGVVYSSSQPSGKFNDSEALLWEFALWMEGWIDKMEAYGSIAFICIEKTNGEPDRLHYFRNLSNPLYVEKTKKRFMLRSQIVPGSSGVLVSPGTLFSVDYDTGEMKQKELELTNYRNVSGVNNSSVEKSYHNPHEDNENVYADIIAEAEGEMAREEAQLALLQNTTVFETDLKNKCADYLETANGYYELAYGMLQEDIEKTQAILNRDYDIHDWYDIELMKGAMAILIVDPFWDKEDANALNKVFNEATATIPTPTESVEPVSETKAPVETKALKTAPEVSVNVDDSTVRLTNADLPHMHRLDDGRKSGAVLVGEVLRTGRFGNHHPISDTPGLVRRIPTNSELRQEVATA